MTLAPGAPAPPSTASAPSAGTVSAAPAELAVADGVDVDAVARAVRACAGVADLHSGRFGEVGSYLPGRRVGGVQVGDTSVTVHVRARWGYSVHDLFAQIDGVTATLRGNRRLAVVVDDIDDDHTATADSAVDAVTAMAVPLAIEPAVATTAPSDHSSLHESSTS